MSNRYPLAALVAGFIALVCLSFSTPVFAQKASVSSQSQYVRVNAHESDVIFCHGFGCRFETEVPFKDDDIAELTHILATGADGPEQEREAVKQAVAFFERHAANYAGTSTDIAGNYTIGGDPTQLDCIDEAHNTARLLILLQKKGLLKYHTVAKIEGRGNFIDTRYPHNTAVLKDKTTGIKWSVDSWMRHNGDIPEVMTLKRWFREGYS
ncbi:MAG: hypothetical protein H6881_07505 [Rhodobiaceae bacterium]|nr:hypothetical protein [Rhodobiaceae bacterium]MCC0051707.1 hypothetical protein [Rhodobiaceae bacterium]MCC0060743.1 hypothetical protein [Rhodobiaceae bacterium]